MSDIGREENDFYRTPETCTQALLAVEKFQPYVWECACGDGAISNVLKAAGYDVFSSDLIDRGYGMDGVNFLAEPAASPGQDIVTNPPYKLADDFVLKCLALGVPKFAFFLRLGYLEGHKRLDKIYRKHPPSKVWVSAERVTLWHGTAPRPENATGTTAYAWFVWEQNRPPEPIGWLPPQRVFGARRNRK